MSKTVTVTLEFNEANLLMLSRLLGAFPDDHASPISENSTGLYHVFDKLATAYEAVYGKEVYTEEDYYIHDALRSGFVLANNKIRGHQQ